MLPDRAGGGPHRHVAGDLHGETRNSSLRLLCDLCRARLDAVLWSVGRHPGCGPNKPLGTSAYDQLISALTTELGATTTTKETAQADRGRDARPGDGAGRLTDPTFDPHHTRQMHPPPH